LEAGSVLPSLNFPQLDFVKPSSGFHPVTWERVISDELSLLTFNIKKEVINVLDFFLSFLKVYDKRKAHNMIFLMLTLGIKTFL
jgi:hypothetical protein